MQNRSENYTTNRDMVLNELTGALRSVDPDSVVKLMDRILSSERVFLVGVGRVQLSLQAIAKRFAHLGIDVHCVGDITEPAITKKDLLIVGSGSGESLLPVAIAHKAFDIGATVAHIGSNPHGAVSRYASLMVRIPVQTKMSLPDEIRSEQPMTSLFEQSLLLLGDILARMIIQEKELDLKSLWQFHANLE